MAAPPPTAKQLAAPYYEVPVAYGGTADKLRLLPGEEDVVRIGQVGLQLPPRHVSYHSMPAGTSLAQNCPMASAIVVPPIDIFVQCPV